MFSMSSKLSLAICVVVASAVVVSANLQCHDNIKTDGSGKQVDTVVNCTNADTKFCFKLHSEKDGKEVDLKGCAGEELTTLKCDKDGHSTVDLAKVLGSPNTGNGELYCCSDKNACNAGNRLLMTTYGLGFAIVAALSAQF